MARALHLLFFSIALAACGGAEPAISFATSSPASTAAPSGQRVPVATALDAADPAQAARSPLLAPPAAAPAMDHSHHHHGHAPASTAAPTAPASSGPAPAMDHSHHQHGGSKP